MSLRVGTGNIRRSTRICQGPCGKRATSEIDALIVTVVIDVHRWLNQCTKFERVRFIPYIFIKRTILQK